jgi:glycosyltransferase involved in cell wall biosynthesis
MGYLMISAIIPTWNRVWSIGRAIDSVLGQKGAEVELIVVDDGSDDGTEEFLIERYGQARFKYIRHTKRLGVSASRNHGIREARGELIAFLDSDDEWLPGKLEAQLGYMVQNPDFLISQCQERWMRNGRRVNPGFRHRKKEGDIFIESLSLCLISPSAVIVRKPIFDLVGMFDEDLPAAEDYDLWLRVLMDHPVGLLDRELIIRHGGRQDQLSSAPGLDRYRITALEKILARSLSPERRQAVEKELARKKSIFERGKAKRLSGEKQKDF